MSTVRARWLAKLRTRRALLATAQSAVAYWARRAGSTRGRQALEEARTRRALRQRQVTDAEHVVARHPADKKPQPVTSVSDAGVAFIAGFEGFRSAPYKDVVGVWTIGYGETGNVGPHTPPWSRAHALEVLHQRVQRDYLPAVLTACKAAGITLRQRQVDALTSLVYNLGPGVLAPGRTMGDALRSRDRARMAAAFLVYDKAGNPPKAFAGLTRRRRAERALFLRK